MREGGWQNGEDARCRGGKVKVQSQYLRGMASASFRSYLIYRIELRVCRDVAYSSGVWFSPHSLASLLQRLGVGRGRTETAAVANSSNGFRPAASLYLLTSFQNAFVFAVSSHSSRWMFPLCWMTLSVVEGQNPKRLVILEMSAKLLLCLSFPHIEERHML